MHNITVLRNMPGDLIEIKAEKKGEIRGIACPAENVVYLKNGCKVMLLWNKSDQLRNGSQGVFVRMDGLHACVNFSEVGLVRIGKETWVKRDSQGSITGSITQLPLATAYALRYHKSQGQTFDAAVVHSSHEFVSGLHYVALSRVRSSKNLQLVNFKRKYLTPVPNIVTRNEGSSVSEVTREDLSCCRFQEVADLALFYANDKNNAVEISICREEDTDDNDQEIQGTLSSFFENDKEIPPINLALVNETLRVHEGELSQPPADFLSDTSLFQVLSSMKSQSTTTLATEKNRTIEKLVGLDNNHKEILRAFVNVIWYNLFDMLDSHTAVNLDNTIAGCISRQQFTATTGNIHNFLQSKEYKGYVKYIFRNEAPQITKAQTLLASELVFIIYTRFLDILSERVRQESDEENVDCSVWDMPAEGQGKIRYVGGWVLKKVIERGRTYVKENMTSKQEGILKKVKQQLEKASLVQNELVAQPDVLCNSSQYPKTLELTEFRQHRERGLFNITDKAFEFFMQLEQVRS
ncbi:uncharacterized protein [Montipora foliosa]|uniref:uncharacterized protein n=1 Tax=Montipora foliosa TaxID=591990 RepID=UPI0035F1CF50